jgi:hypothetical protein
MQIEPSLLVHCEAFGKHPSYRKDQLPTAQTKSSDPEYPCQLSVRRLEDVHPHPTYVKHHLRVSDSQLSALIKIGELPFQQPILVTRDGFIIDGYARWELAKRQKRKKILCLEYVLSDEESIRWLVQTHLPSKGLNSYCRARLASDLEPSLRETARANQQTGGQIKSSSTLTEAQRIDVRSELAAIAQVSSGHLTKAKQVSASAPAPINQALKASEISVHKAWQWRSLTPCAQITKLQEHRTNKGTGLVSRRLIGKHVAKTLPTRLIPPNLGTFS